MSGNHDSSWQPVEAALASEHVINHMILIIGYGSTLRSDDGAGQHVAREVAAQGWPAVRSLAVTQLTPELAAEIAQAEQVIFVDAIAGDGAQAVQVTDVTLAEDGEGVDTNSTGAMTHHATPQGLLNLARTLYDSHPIAMLVSIPGINFELGEHLSPLALQGTEVALHLIGIQVVDYLTKRSRQEI